MRASVVIPSYNGRSLLETCLISLQHQKVSPGHSFEVIVVDDGSDDGTGDTVQQLKADYDLSYLYRPRDAESCRSVARNLGIDHADGDVIIMVDGDQIIPPGFVDEHLRIHRSAPDAVGVGTRVRLDRGVVNNGLLAERFTMDAMPPVVRDDSRAPVMAALSENLNNLAGRWHLFFSCNASVRREHLVAVGGFEEAFKAWGMEDTELGYRLHRRGLCFVYAPWARLFHLDQPVPIEKRCLGWRENFGKFSAKHAEPEVAAQAVFGRVFNLDGPEMKWREAFRRFEQSVRVLHGREPKRGGLDLLTVDDDNLAAVRTRLAAGPPERNLLVVDLTDDRDLPIQVQTIRSPYELLYYKNPDPTVLDTLYPRHAAEFGSVDGDAPR